MVSILGADINGNTPLHAVFLGLTQHGDRKTALEIANLFIKHGANPNYINMRGTSPIDLAKEHGIEYVGGEFK